MKILIGGDLKGYTAPYKKYFKENENPSIIFGDLLKYIKEADVAVYNQEFPITKNDEISSAKKSGRIAKHGEDLIEAVNSAGFNLATFATNHTLDFGLQGLNDTIEGLNGKNISVVGAGNSLENAEKPFFYIENGIKICVLNYAENQYNVATFAHGGANPLNVIENYYQIKKYKKENDFVFVIIHGGTDFCQYPSPRMVSQYQFYVDAGASAVINHHQHVVSGYEIYKDAPIFYGIANVIPGEIVLPGCLFGIALLFNINKDEVLKWKMIPLKFDENGMRLNELQGEDRLTFLNDIEKISKDISNKYTLKEKYSSFLENDISRIDFNLSFSRKRRYLFRVMKKLNLVNFLGDVFTVGKGFKNNELNSTLWNLMRCESHQDALDYYFNEDIDKVE